jgi:RNA recognition motif-containing protein
MLSQIKHQYSDRKVFLGGLAWSTTEESLKEYLEKELNIVVEKVTIMRDRQTGNSRGFGFVILDKAEDAAAVVSANLLLDSKKIEAKRAIPKDEIQESNTRKLFVGGIPVNISDEEFKNHFEKFGCVTEIQIVKDRNTGKSRGFGFVTFEDKEIVDNVLTFPHILLGKQVEVKRAEPKKSTPTNETQPGDEYMNYFLQQQQINDYPEDSNIPFSQNEDFSMITSGLENFSLEEPIIRNSSNSITLPSPRNNNNVMDMNQVPNTLPSPRSLPMNMNEVNQLPQNRSNMVSPRNKTDQTRNTTRNDLTQLPLQRNSLISPRNNSGLTQSARNGRISDQNIVQQNPNTQPNSIKRSKSMEHLKVVGSRPFGQNEPNSQNTMYTNTPLPSYRNRSLFAIKEETNYSEENNHPEFNGISEEINEFPDYPPMLPNMNDPYNQFMNSPQFMPNNQFPPNQFSNSFGYNNIMMNQYQSYQYQNNNGQQFPYNFGMNGSNHLPNNFNNQYPNNPQYQNNPQFYNQFNGYHQNQNQNVYNNNFNNNSGIDPNLFYDPNLNEESANLSYLKLNKRKSFSGRLNGTLY